MRKEIEGYTVEDWEDCETNRLFCAVKDNSTYFLSMCPQNTPSPRIKEIKDRFKKDILTGSNVSLPTYIKSGTRWVCVEPYLPSILHGYGAKAFFCLPPAHRQRILLGAVNALQTLHWAGLVHGGISSNCFRVIAAKDSSFRTILTGLAYAGKPTKRKEGYPTGFEAPEMSGGLTEKTDIYALGAVICFWLTGNFPVRGESNKLLIPSYVPFGYGVLLAGLLEPDAQKRITLDRAIEILHNPSLKEGDNYTKYFMDNSIEESRMDHIRDIQEIHTDFSEGFSSKIKSYYNW